MLPAHSGPDLAPDFSAFVCVTVHVVVKAAGEVGLVLCFSQFCVCRHHPLIGRLFLQGNDYRPVRTSGGFVDMRHRALNTRGRDGTADRFVTYLKWAGADQTLAERLYTYNEIGRAHV